MNDEMFRRCFAFERERAGVAPRADQSEERKVSKAPGADHVLCTHDTLECAEPEMRVRFWIERECGAAPIRRKQRERVRRIRGDFVVAYSRDDFVLCNGCECAMCAERYERGERHDVDAIRGGEQRVLDIAQCKKRNGRRCDETVRGVTLAQLRRLYTRGAPLHHLEHQRREVRAGQLCGQRIEQTGYAEFSNDTIDRLFQSGKPSTRFAMTFSCTSLVPPSIEFAFERSHCRVVPSSRSVKPLPSQPTACVPIVSSSTSYLRLFCSVP